ncbi:MAG: AAA family ATPase [Chloroflexota bacterium]
MKRIVIIGNSGSGKTHLGQILSSCFGYRLIHLDTLFWEPGGFNIKRSNEIVYAEIARIRQTKTWIVEGVFGELAKEFCVCADTLIWLDQDWETCSRSLLQRGPESSKQLDKQSAEENFQNLLQWASEYWQRETPSSYRGHLLLFERFNNDKIRLQSRKAVNDFGSPVINGKTLTK